MTEYKAFPFDPAIGNQKPSSDVATSLQTVLDEANAKGWEFIGIENHSTIVPGSSGCFGLGATSPYERTFSVAVFKK